MAKRSVFGTSVMGPDESAVGTVGNIAEMFNPENQAKGVMNQAHAEYYRQHGEQAAATKLLTMAKEADLRAKMASRSYDALVAAGYPPAQARVMSGFGTSAADAATGAGKIAGLFGLNDGSMDKYTALGLATGHPLAATAAPTTGDSSRILDTQNQGKKDVATIAETGRVAAAEKNAAAHVEAAKLKAANDLAIASGKPIVLAPGHTVLTTPGDKRIPDHNATPSAPVEAKPDETSGVVPLPGSAITEAPSGLTSMFGPTAPEAKPFDFYGSNIKEYKQEGENAPAASDSIVPTDLSPPKQEGFSLSAPDAGIEAPKLNFDNNAFLAAHPDVPFSSPSEAPAPAPAAITNADGTPFKAAPSAAPSAGPSNVFTAPGGNPHLLSVPFGNGVFDPNSNQFVVDPSAKNVPLSNNQRLVNPKTGEEVVSANAPAANPRTAINEERLNKEAAEAVGKQSGVGVGIRGGKDKKGKTISGMVPTEHADAIGRAARQAYPELAPSDAVALFIKNQGITFDKEDDQHWYSPNSPTSAKIPMVIPRVGGKPFLGSTPVADAAVPASPTAPAPDSVVPAPAAAPTPAATPAPASGPVKVSNKAEYDRLPSGSRYLHPDGTIKIKQ